VRVCLVVPMYNEEVIARSSIETIQSYIRELPPVITLLVVNDASKDNTEKVVKEMIDKRFSDNMQLISHPLNKGYGAAIRSGIKYAIANNYDYAVFMDSDLTDHPKYLKDFYQKMTEGWDYIKGTRKSKGGGYTGVTWKRRVISRCGNIFARIVTKIPLTDITYGFRAVKINIIKKIELKEDHFAVIIEELMKLRKITNNFCEIPCILSTRGPEARPTKFVYNISTFFRYLKYLFRT